MDLASFPPVRVKDGGEVRTVSGQQLFRLVRERELGLPQRARAKFRQLVVARLEELLTTPPAEQVLAQAIRDAVEDS